MKLVYFIAAVEAPEDATHYSGDLDDHPFWWKHQVNSTGVIKAWYCCSPSNGQWLWYCESLNAEPPAFVFPIPQPIRRI